MAAPNIVPAALATAPMWGGRRSLSGDSDMRKKLALALAGKALSTEPIRSPWQGAAQMSQALLAGLELREADRQQKALVEALGGMTFGGAPGVGAETVSPVAASPAPPPAPATAPGIPPEMFDPAPTVPRQDSGQFQTVPVQPDPRRLAEALRGGAAVSGQGLDPRRAAFVEALAPHAQRVSEQTGLDPRLVIAQGALESGWGRSAPGNNVFGIKSHGRAGGQTLPTTEVVNGRQVRINDSFRQYPDIGASADDYAQFLRQNPRYRPLLGAQGLDAQVEALGRSSYATDPQYGAKVGAIARALTTTSGASPMLNPNPTMPVPETDSFGPQVRAPNERYPLNQQVASLDGMAPAMRQSAPPVPGMGASFQTLPFSGPPPAAQTMPFDGVPMQAQLLGQSSPGSQPVGGGQMQQVAQAQAPGFNSFAPGLGAPYREVPVRPRSLPPAAPQQTQQAQPAPAPPQAVTQANVWQQHLNQIGAAYRQAMARGDIATAQALIAMGREVQGKILALNDPLRQLQMENIRSQIDHRRAQQVQGGGVYGTPVYGRDPRTGEPVVGAIGKDGTFRRLDTGGVQVTPGVTWQDFGTHRQAFDRGGQPVGPPVARSGQLSPDQFAVTDPGGNVVGARPVPGSKRAEEVADAQRKAEQQRAQREKYADVVTSDIDRALSIVDRSSWPVTGLIGQATSNIPGTPSHDLARLVETIKANAGFDRLQEMRAASPTGGALGQVSDFENRLLQSTIGNLAQSQTKDQFVRNLRRVRNIYTRIIHEGIRDPGEDDGWSQNQGGATAPVPVQTPDEARRLPSGTTIRLPDGTLGRVP